MRGNKLRKKGITIVVSLCILFITLTSCSSIKVPPAGVDFESEEYHSEIAEFNYDLSYLTKDGDVAYDTNIFKNVYKQIDDAKDFFIIDIFLYNQIYNRNFGKFPTFAENFSKKLIDKKKRDENIKIYH